jgi:DNA-binding transcriptional LysR family regulator
MNKTLSSDDLDAFIRVVDGGSFAAAAAGTGLTPSGMSRAISRLEDKLGIRVMQRTTRRLMLTPEGEALLARGREIIAALEAAGEEAGAGRARPRGLVRVNVGTAFAKHRLAPVLPLFRELHPDIRLELAINDRRVEVTAEQTDIAIRTGPLGDSSLVARRIGGMKRVICASPGYVSAHGRPNRPEELAHHNCLLLTGFARLAEWPMRIDGRETLMQVTGSITCDSADLLLDMALAGVGVVRFGDFLAEEALAEGRLVPLLEAWHIADPQPVTVLMPPGRHTIPRVRAVVDFLAAQCGDRPGVRRDERPPSAPETSPSALGGPPHMPATSRQPGPGAPKA